MFGLIILIGFLRPISVKALNSLMPADPSSPSSYQTIKDYYQISGGLPAYQQISNDEIIYDHYKIRIIKLAVKNLPEVTFVLKLPLKWNKPLPAIVLFSGYQTGAQAIQLVDVPDSVAYVGFEYPWPLDISDQSAHWDWKRIEVIPVLMAMTLVWLNHQDFIDHQKISVVNVSFGNLFFPLAQRILGDQGFYPKATVFGYGGVGISEIIGNHFINKINSFELEMLKIMIKNQTWMIEPQYHLPHLRGPFLVVNGEDDNVFPRKSRQQLVNALSVAPKVVSLPGGHIQPDRPDLIQNFMKEVFLFLKKENAL